MSDKDPYASILPKTTIGPAAARTTTTTGTSVDRAASGAMYQAAALVVTTGTVTDGTHTVELQHSDDNSTWAAVPDAQLQGTEPAIVAADDDKVFVLGYLGRKRYLRAVITASGSPATGAVYLAQVVLTNPRVMPAVQA
ncbi:hypothetical protein ACIA59_10600 [Micromonospora haikouensis]|uniref:hypothetical protein n=1 Tax=Micromonospora haikouensis TaxID=686309 RepID=UPI0037B13493